MDSRVYPFYFKCMLFCNEYKRNWLSYLFHLKGRPTARSLMDLQCWVDVTLIRQVAATVETSV
jgi:hypothetical protein